MAAYQWQQFLIAENTTTNIGGNATGFAAYREI